MIGMTCSTQWKTTANVSRFPLKTHIFFICGWATYFIFLLVVVVQSLWSATKRLSLQKIVFWEHPTPLATSELETPCLPPKTSNSPSAYWKGQVGSGKVGCAEKQTQTQERGATHWAAFYKVLVMIPMDQIKKKKKKASQFSPKYCLVIHQWLGASQLSFLAF